MKIVFIIDQLYLHGGIERVLSIKANYFSSIKENTVHIITTEQKQKEACYNFNSNIIFKDLGINYCREKSYFNPENLLKVPGHIFKLKKTLNKIKPDIAVVCSHSVDTYFVPFINKIIPKVKEFHYSKFIEIDKRQNPSSRFKKWFIQFADYVETKYDALVVLNPDEASYYNSNNTKIIPNPLTFYPETVSKLDNPIAIAAGRIAPVKRYDVLIDIWALVHKTNKNWQLYIYGNGEENFIKNLQMKIDDLELTQHVFLKGPTNHIQEKMLHSSLFLMTSDNECFPLVLLEAQACGLPIISFDCPHGPRNIISDENGSLVNMKDLKVFSKEVLELMSNSNKRIQLGTNARNNANNYSVEKIMPLWKDMFKGLINT
ncbi:glycosyltransferase family 4 protein [Flavobacteriaceae bacterium GSB9]|nr:glycosyltransferase family 4 protein [Flavobacteriaceae bacterium GSB9]